MSASEGSIARQNNSNKSWAEDRSESGNAIVIPLLREYESRVNGIEVTPLDLEGKERSDGAVEKVDRERRKEEEEMVEADSAH